MGRGWILTRQVVSTEGECNVVRDVSNVTYTTMAGETCTLGEFGKTTLGELRRSYPSMNVLYRKAAFTADEYIDAILAVSR